jgi:ABC-type antimicrobial peptide transport system permease subunit
MGYLIARFVSYMLVQMLDWEIPIIFPLKFVFISLVLVLVAAFVISQFPILRAVRMRLGDALRYQ